MKLIVFCGLPGTGKSTLSYFLAKKLQATLLTRDAIDRSLEQNGIKNSKASYDLLLDLTRLNLSQKNTVVLDAVFGTTKLRETAKLIATEQRAEYLLVYTLCLEELNYKRRIEDRPAMVDGWTPANWKEVERVKTYFERPEEKDNLLELDTSKALEETKRTLLSFIE